MTTSLFMAEKDRLKRFRQFERSWDLNDYLGNKPKCMHSQFSGSAKDRRAMRRWHRKHNPTCNDTLMDNLRLGVRCGG